jgi:hypothetical protein
MKQGKYGTELNLAEELQGAWVIDNCATLSYQGVAYTVSQDWDIGPEHNGQREFTHLTTGEVVTVPCIESAYGE